MQVFEASVQYNDLKGTVAADRADSNDAAAWLRKHGHITDEYVIGISMWAGENHGTHRDPVIVTFLVTSLNGFKNLQEMLQASGDPIKVKQVRVEMNVADFFALFKRLDITLSIKGLVEGRSLAVEE